MRLDILMELDWDSVTYLEPEPAEVIPFTENEEPCN